LVGAAGSTHAITMKNGKISADSIDVDSIIAAIGKLEYLEVRGLRVGSTSSTGSFYFNGYNVSRSEKASTSYTHVLSTLASPG